MNKKSYKKFDEKVAEVYGWDVVQNTCFLLEKMEQLGFSPSAANEYKRMRIEKVSKQTNVLPLPKKVKPVPAPRMKLGQNKAGEVFQECKKCRHSEYICELKKCPNCNSEVQDGKS